MKKTFVVLFMLTYLLSYSQVEIGLRGGLNSINLISNSIILPVDNNQMSINFSDSDYGYHFGLYTRFSALGLYVEPGLIFNSNTVNYKISEFTEDGVFTKVRKEKYNNIDVPLLLGIKAGVIRLYGGPVAHLHIRSSSELFDIKNYSQRFKTATYGYQAGFGFDIGKIRLDLSYEGNFSNFGNHITINDTPYSFDQSGSRLIGSIGFSF